MKPISKENLKMIGISWGVGLVLSGLIFNFVIMSQLKETKAFKATIAEKKHLCEFAQNMKDEEIREKFQNDIENLRGELGKYLVDFDDSSNLTFDISQIANEKKVSSFSIKTTDQKKAKPISTSSDIYTNQAKVKFASGFKQFAEMLNALERHSPVFFVEEFKIKRSVDNDTKNNSVDMNISFLVKKSQQG